MNNISDQTKRDPLLVKAFDVFVRYGYRKTSLDEVGRAIGLSRQTLYQRYKSKENLFRSIIQEFMENINNVAVLIFEDQTLSLEQQLFKVFDYWTGGYFEMLNKSPHITELIDASNALVGDILKLKQEEYINIIASALDRSVVAMQYSKHGITSQQIARMLYATSKGIAHLSADKDSFDKEMDIAIRIVIQEKE